MKIVLALLGFVAVLVVSPALAYLSQPWSAWWISSTGSSTTTPVLGGLILPPDLPSIADQPPQSVGAPPVAGGRVSDIERFQLITAAGAPRDVAIVMTAISIAEDGSGDPAIASAPNFNKTIDLGLWQINSSHWGQSAVCGSRQELVVPINNARCAMSILGPGLNYCAWSTFEASCGVGHTGAYRAFLAGATQIAGGGAWQH